MRATQTPAEVIAAVQELKEERDDVRWLTGHLLGVLHRLSNSLALTGQIDPDALAEVDQLTWQVREYEVAATASV
jgi:hypothetical protein